MQFLFPFEAMVLALVVYSRDPSFPISAILAIYPIGLIPLAASPLMFKERSSGAANLLNYAQGARWGIIVSGVFSIPVFILLADALGQRALALGVLTIAIGSIWLPYSSAGVAYGRILGQELRAPSFVEQVRRSPFSFERVSSVFLAIYLGQLTILAKTGRALLLVLFSILFCVAGWISLGQVGGYAWATLGLVLSLLVPLLSWLSLRSLVPSESRKQVGHLLEESLEKQANA